MMPEPLRVVHLIKSLGRGGAEVLLPETLRYADRSRFSFRYAYFIPWKDAMVGPLQDQGVDVDCISARNNVSILLSASRVTRLLRKSRADLLHCHLPVAGVVGRVAGRLAGVPVIYTEHNKQGRYHAVTRKLNLATWEWQSRVVAVSGDVADSIRSHTSSRVPVDVVLNGVDVERFDRSTVDADAVRREFGIASSAPVVGTVAVFRTQKRLDDWLEAAALLRERVPEVRFLLVGDGPLRDELKKRAVSLDLVDVVYWPGLKEDVRPYLAAMDVYLMSSIFEGLPIALLEAMSMECSVVSTAVGGIPELIVDGENGLLCEPSEPERLAELVGGLFSDRPQLERLGAAARRTVREGFSVERMSRELEALYLEVANGTSNGH